MKALAVALAAAAALIAADAQAQDVNLTGPWRCVDNCASRGGFIIQTGRQLELADTRGKTTRGWFDYPGHLWLEDARMRGETSLNGNAIKFANGTVWVRPWLARHRHWR